jgi:hypothetical protein
MEHRWGQRLSSNIPVRLRCMQARDTGCRCLGYMESVSASGALIRTELGICPAPNIVIETPPSTFAACRQLPASVVRAGAGALTVEWLEWPSADVSAVMAESMLHSAGVDGEHPRLTLGRVPFCERSHDSGSPGLS